ncbi:hypothetical protein FQA39_LY11073 [Lamprigera yunnana]|nr:hypothetical protein FQA39_LY11073 [Lamprigera yunnana]
MANDKHNECKECGCGCRKTAVNDHDLHLHVEIENLKQKLVERDNHIATMENNVLNEANKFPSGEVVALQEELFTWQDKYKRLYEAHRRIQRVNQGLEDKLLKLVDIGESDKNTLTKDIATLSHKLAEANYTIKKLTEDNERYKTDVALAIQFLQCKQSNFVSQKLDSLPNEVQAKVSSYVTGKRKSEEKKTIPEVRNIKVPIPTFPPTAMVYSIPKTAEQFEEKDEQEEPIVDIVSAAIMAKVLEERERERSSIKHCDTCVCAKSLKIVHEVVNHSVSTQTGNDKSSLCLRCNTDMDLTPIQIVKSCEKSKNVPIYTNEYDNCPLQVRLNVVKVEPNNYLKENNSASSFDSSPVLNSSENSKLSNRDMEILKRNNKFQNFHCEKSAKVKGPRYCSVRMQSGTKNILLDNVHTIAPVLYTHPADKKLKNIIRTNNNTGSQTHSYSSDERKSIDLVAESVLNQQRVAEWIQSNQNNMIEEDPHSDSINVIDPVKYAEMENNVKKFLFGESQSEFLKKVAIGKQNYQNLRIRGDKSNTTQSHTETQI